jgi:hypothetical protein
MAESSLPDPAEDDIPEPPRLRALRLAVMFLTVSAAVAILAIAAALVIRVTTPAPGFDASSVRTDAVAAPPGEDIVAAGGAAGAIILVTRDTQGVERLRFYDAADGTARRVVVVDRAR